jgi:hypothetical protein
LSNVETAPDGTLTADKIIPDTASIAHSIYNSFTLAPSTRYTYRVYAKAGGYGSIRFGNLTTATAPRSGRYNLESGTVDEENAQYPGGFQHIEDVGNGWYLCTFSFVTHPTYTAMRIVPVPLSEALSTYGPSYAGDGTSGVYLWGASLTATEYPVEYTTTRNVLTDSQDFERSGWTKSSLSSWYDGYQDPFGGDEGSRIVENSSLGTHAVLQNATFQNADYVLSFYAKKGARSQIQGTISLADGNSFANFDIDAGTVIASGAGATATITDVGNGWFRCTVSKAIAAASTQTRIAIFGFYVGDGASDFYLYGAQLEPGTTATNYVRTVDVVGKAYGFYEPTEGTVFVTSTRYSNDNAFQRAVTFGSASPSITNQLSILKYNTLEAGYLAAPGLQLNKPLISAGTEMRSAFAAKIGDHAFTINGATPATSAVSQGIGDGMVQMLIGHTAGPGQIQNGHIKRLTYWPVRQADSTLEVITQ